MKKVCVIITGMHRSGTSAMAGSLKMCGLEFGGDLIKPSINNMMGYFENRGTLMVNKSLLSGLSSSWDSTAKLPPYWWTQHSCNDLFRGERAFAKYLIEREFGKYPLFGIKDPRFCITLPFWFDILSNRNIKVVCVVMRRSFKHIVDSLQRRDTLVNPGKELENSTTAYLKELCRKYYSSMDKHTERIGFNRIDVKFKELLDNPEKTISGIIDKFRLGIKYNPKVIPFLEE